MILNDLSFAAPEIARHLSPDSRFNPIAEKQKAQVFKEAAVFYSTCILIGRYLDLGISEYTLIPELKRHITKAELKFARDEDPLLAGFAIDELSYNKSEKAYYLPLYRKNPNGKKTKAFTYKYYIEGDPKDADMRIPLATGKNIYIKAEAVEEPAGKTPASKLSEKGQEMKSPAGSIPAVFAFLCDNNINTPKTALTTDEIAKALGRSGKTIKYDIRGLYRHLQLIDRSDGEDKGAGERYYVPESVQKKLTDLMPTLDIFVKENLRPTKATLELVNELFIRHLFTSDVITKNDISSFDRLLRKFESYYSEIAGYIQAGERQKWTNDPISFARRIASYEKMMLNINGVFIAHFARYSKPGTALSQKYIELNNMTVQIRKDLGAIRFKAEVFVQNGEFDTIFRPIRNKKREFKDIKWNEANEEKFDELKELFKAVVDRLETHVLIDISSKLDKDYKYHGAVDLKSRLAVLSDTIETMKNKIPSIDVEAILNEQFLLAQRAEELLQYIKKKIYEADMDMLVGALTINHDIGLPGPYLQNSQAHLKERSGVTSLPEGELKDFMLMIEETAPREEPMKGSSDEQFTEFSLPQLALMLNMADLKWGMLEKLTRLANREWERLGSAKRLWADDETGVLRVSYVKRSGVWGKIPALSWAFKKVGKKLGLSGRAQTVLQTMLEQAAFWTIGILFMPAVGNLWASAITWSAFFALHFVRTARMPQAPPWYKILAVASLNALGMSVPVYGGAGYLAIIFAITSSAHLILNNPKPKLEILPQKLLPTLNISASERSITDHIFAALGVHGMPILWRKLGNNFSITSIPAKSLNADAAKTAFNLHDADVSRGELLIIRYDNVPASLCFVPNRSSAYVVDLYDYYTVDAKTRGFLYMQLDAILPKNGPGGYLPANLSYPYTYIFFGPDGRFLALGLEKRGDESAVKIPILPNIFTGAWQSTSISAQAADLFAKRGMDVLIGGSGQGVDTVIAARKGSRVDAFDIKRMAVENTKLAASIAGFEVDARVSDLFDGLDSQKQYDLIIFNMPHTLNKEDASKIEPETLAKFVDTPFTHNVIDHEGILLARLARQLRSRLKPGGRAVLVNRKSDAAFITETLEKYTGLKVSTAFTDVGEESQAYIIHNEVVGGAIPGSDTPKAQVKPEAPSMSGVAGDLEQAIAEYATSIQQDFFAALERHGLFDVPGEGCKIASRIMAKLIADRFGIPIGGEANTRVEVIPGQCGPRSGYHEWVGVFTGAPSPALYIDARYDIFDPEYKHVLIAEPYSQAISKYRLSELRAILVEEVKRAMAGEGMDANDIGFGIDYLRMLVLSGELRGTRIANLLYDYLSAERVRGGEIKSLEKDIEAGIEIAFNELRDRFNLQRPEDYANIRRSLNLLLENALLKAKNYNANEGVTTRQVADVQMIPTQFLTDPKNVDVVAQQSDPLIMQLAEKIARGDLSDTDKRPVRIDVRADGKISVYDGMHRIAAFAALDVDYIPVLVMYLNKDLVGMLPFENIGAWIDPAQRKPESPSMAHQGPTVLGPAKDMARSEPFDYGTFIIDASTGARVSAIIRESDGDGLIECRIDDERAGAFAYFTTRSTNTNDRAALVVANLKVEESNRRSKNMGRNFQYVGSRLLQAAVRLSMLDPEAQGALRLTANEKNKNAQGFYGSFADLGLKSTVNVTAENITYYLDRQDAQRFIDGIEARLTGRKPESPDMSAPTGETPDADSGTFNKETRQRLLASITNFIRVIDKAPEVQVRKMEQFVIDNMEKFEESDEASTLMSALVTIWIRLSKISNVPAEMYTGRIGLLVENIFRLSRLFDEKTHREDVSLLLNYIETAGIQDAATLAEIRKDVSERTLKAESKEIAPFIDYRLFETKDMVIPAIDAKLDHLERLAKQAAPDSASRKPESPDMAAPAAPLLSSQDLIKAGRENLAAGKYWVGNELVRLGRALDLVEQERGRPAFEGNLSRREIGAILASLKKGGYTKKEIRLFARQLAKCVAMLNEGKNSAEIIAALSSEYNDIHSRHSLLDSFRHRIGDFVTGAHHAEISELLNKIEAPKFFAFDIDLTLTRADTDNFNNLVTLLKEDDTSFVGIVTHRPAVFGSEEEKDAELPRVYEDFFKKHMERDGIEPDNHDFFIGLITTPAAPDRNTDWLPDKNNPFSSMKYYWYMRTKDPEGRIREYAIPADSSYNGINKFAGLGTLVEHFRDKFADDGGLTRNDAEVFARQFLHRSILVLADDDIDHAHLPVTGEPTQENNSNLIGPYSTSSSDNGLSELFRIGRIVIDTSDSTDAESSPLTKVTFKFEKDVLTGLRAMISDPRYRANTVALKIKAHHIADTDRPLTPTADAGTDPSQRKPESPNMDNLITPAAADEASLAGTEQEVVERDGRGRIRTVKDTFGNVWEEYHYGIFYNVVKLRNLKTGRMDIAVKSSAVKSSIKLHKIIVNGKEGGLVDYYSDSHTIPTLLVSDRNKGVGETVLNWFFKTAWRDGADHAGLSGIANPALVHLGRKLIKEPGNISPEEKGPATVEYAVIEAGFDPFTQTGKELGTINVSGGRITGVNLPENLSPSLDGGRVMVRDLSTGKEADVIILYKNPRRNNIHGAPDPIFPLLRHDGTIEYRQDGRKSGSMDKAVANGKPESPNMAAPVANGGDEARRWSPKWGMGTVQGLRKILVIEYGHRDSYHKKLADSLKAKLPRALPLTEIIFVDSADKAINLIQDPVGRSGIDAVVSTYHLADIEQYSKMTGAQRKDHSAAGIIKSLKDYGVEPYITIVHSGLDGWSYLNDIRRRCGVSFFRYMINKITGKGIHILGAAYSDDIVGLLSETDRRLLKRSIAVFSKANAKDGASPVHVPAALKDLARDLESAMSTLKKSKPVVAKFSDKKTDSSLETIITEEEDADELSFEKIKSKKVRTRDMRHRGRFVKQKEAIFIEQEDLKRLEERRGIGPKRKELMDGTERTIPQARKPESPSMAGKKKPAPDKLKTPEASQAAEKQIDKDGISTMIEILRDIVIDNISKTIDTDTDRAIERLDSVSARLKALARNYASLDKDPENYDAYLDLKQKIEMLRDQAMFLRGLYDESSLDNYLEEKPESPDMANERAEGKIGESWVVSRNKDGVLQGELTLTAADGTKTAWAKFMIEPEGIALNYCLEKRVYLTQKGYGKELLSRGFMHARQEARRQGFDPQWALIYYEIAPLEEWDVATEAESFLKHLGFTRYYIFMADPENTPLMTLVKKYPYLGHRQEASGHFVIGLDAIIAKSTQPDESNQVRTDNRIAPETSIKRDWDANPPSNSREWMDYLTAKEHTGVYEQVMANVETQRTFDAYAAEAGRLFELVISGKVDDRDSHERLMLANTMSFYTMTDPERIRAIGEFAKKRLAEYDSELRDGPKKSGIQTIKPEAPSMTADRSEAMPNRMVPKVAHINATEKQLYDMAKSDLGIPFVAKDAEAALSLASEIDAADPYTLFHSRNVAIYSVAIAEEVALRAPALTELANYNEFEETLKMAALLHDLGKIEVPLRILNKASPLTPEEVEIMSRHPDAGARILEPLEELEGILPGIRTHHERYDGSGYPLKIKGDAIPLIGRIIAVADAFDAMTTDRAYQKAKPVEDAIAELKRSSGTLFDPIVIEAFLRAHERGAIKVTLRMEQGDGPKGTTRQTAKPEAPKVADGNQNAAPEIVMDMLDGIFNQKGLRILVDAYERHNAHMGLGSAAIVEVKDIIKQNKYVFGMLEQILIALEVPAERYEDGLLNIEAIGGIATLRKTLAMAQKPEAPSMAAGMAPKDNIAGKEKEKVLAKIKMLRSEAGEAMTAKQYGRAAETHKKAISLAERNIARSEDKEFINRLQNMISYHQNRMARAMELDPVRSESKLEQDKSEWKKALEETNQMLLEKKKEDEQKQRAAEAERLRQEKGRELAEKKEADINKALEAAETASDIVRKSELVAGISEKPEVKQAIEALRKVILIYGANEEIKEAEEKLESDIALVEELYLESEEDRKETLRTVTNDPDILLARVTAASEKMDKGERLLPEETFVSIEASFEAIKASLVERLASGKRVKKRDELIEKIRSIQAGIEKIKPGANSKNGAIPELAKPEAPSMAAEMAPEVRGKGIIAAMERESRGSSKDLQKALRWLEAHSKADSLLLDLRSYLLSSLKFDKIYADKASSVEEALRSGKGVCWEFACLAHYILYMGRARGKNTIDDVRMVGFKGMFSENHVTLLAKQAGVWWMLDNLRLTRLDGTSYEEARMSALNIFREGDLYVAVDINPEIKFDNEKYELSIQYNPRTGKELFGDLNHASVITGSTQAPLSDNGAIPERDTPQATRPEVPNMAAENSSRMSPSGGLHSASHFPAGIALEDARIEAIKFADTIKLVNIANQKDPVILALGTSWIKGYERRNSRQYADINSLIIAIRNYCKERGVTFIDKDDKDLLAEIGKAREANPSARVVVLADQETITSDEFATLRNDARAFLAGVDSNGIDETCYMRITEMLRMALRLGLRDMLTAIADLNNPYVKADPYKTFRNVYIFLPKAEKLPDYDSLRQLYRVQEFA